MAEVGFGAARITPALPVVLAGFGARKGPVSEVHDDLEVHAVVFRDGELTLCLLVLDLLLLGPDYAHPIRAAVAATLGIPKANVLTSCTHTHSGPAATRSMRIIGWPAQAGYCDRLIQRCVDAATIAAACCTPAEFRFASAPLPEGLSLNRRGLDYHPTFAALDIRRPDGGRIGSIANIAIHPVAAGITARAVSRDWVGSFRDEATLLTGAPCVLLPGALGDVNPTRDAHTNPDPGGNWETARQLGVDVARCVADLLDKTVPAGERASAARHRIERIKAGFTVPSVLVLKAGRSVEVELTEWALGETRLVSLPGEAFHRLGVEVTESRDDPVLLAGLAPHWLGYLPCPFGTGYEEKMSFGKGFVERLRAALLV